MGVASAKRLSMTFLPLVIRELRTASRRKSTFRIRRWIALIAFIVGFFFIAAGYVGSRDAGQSLFVFLTKLAIGFALLAGVFLTPDCISEEKREGTLGLLFLTDLKGYDVVLGKFIARSLNAFYGLLAFLPVAAISLLLGGLTGGEFWRMTLALLNFLFVVLALGIFVSALVRESRVATSATFLLIIFVFAVLPLLSPLSTIAHLPNPLKYPGYFSPTNPCIWSDDSNYRSARGFYWSSLAASHLLGWLLLAFTSWLLPRVWQEKPLVSKGRNLLSRLRRQGRGTPAQRAKARQKLLPINPILWLVGDERVLRRVVWVIVSAWAILIIAASSQLTSEALVGTLYGTKFFGFLLKIIVASQASRFFVESRKSGALELLLCTPLRNREIIRGQWLALRRLFLWPLAIFVLLNLTPIIFLIARAVPGANLGQTFASLIGVLALNCWFTLGLVVDIFTIGWVGMWLGLTAKKPDLAPVWTILFVLILPSFVCGVDLLVDIFLMIWASSRLQQDIRWTLARQYQVPLSNMTPQMILPYVPPPPVIAR